MRWLRYAVILADLSDRTPEETAGRELCSVHLAFCRASIVLPGSIASPPVMIATILRPAPMTNVVRLASVITGIFTSARVAKYRTRLHFGWREAVSSMVLYLADAGSMRVEGRLPVLI